MNESYCILNYYKTNGAECRCAKKENCVWLHKLKHHFGFNNNLFEWNRVSAFHIASYNFSCRPFFVQILYSLYFWSFLFKYSKGHWLILWMRFRVQFYSIWLKTSKAFKKQENGMVNRVETNFWLLNSAQMNVIQNIF